MKSAPKARYLRIGILCRLFRGRERLTQSQAARKIGIDVKAYQHLEGAQHEPSGHLPLQINERAGWIFTSQDCTTWMTREAVEQLLGVDEE